MEARGEGERIRKTGECPEAVAAARQKKIYFKSRPCELRQPVNKMRSLPTNIRNALRGSKDGYAAVAKLRGTIDIELYPALIAWLPNAARSEIGLLTWRFPRSYRSIRPLSRHMSAIPLERELLWTAHFLLAHAELLNRFVQNREALDRYLLLGDYASCLTILDREDEDGGFSLWSLELRIAILSAEKGLEHQKQFMSRIRNECEGRFASFFAYWISQRNEQTTNALRYQSTFVDSTRAWQLTDDFSAYLNYRVADYVKLSPSSISAILRAEATSPVLDYFDTFARLAIEVFSSEEAASLRNIFAESILLLSDAIHDPRLLKLRFMIHPATTDLANVRLADADKLNRFLAGVTRDTDTDLSGEVFDLRIVPELLVETGAAPPESTESVCAFLATGLYRLYARTGAGDDILLEVLRWLYNLRLTQFAFFVDHLGSEQISSVPFDSAGSRRAFLSSSFLDPSCILSLSDEAQNEMVASLDHRDSNAAALARTFLRENGGIQISVEHALVFDALARFVRGHFARVIELTATIPLSFTAHNRRRLKRLHANSLLKNNDLSICTAYIVQCCLEDPGCVRMMPIEECTAALNKAALKKQANLIVTPILFDLHARYVDDRVRDLRGYTYEDFLLTHGLDRPSQLRSVLAEFDPQLLIYYLRYVCVPEVMQISTAFQSSREVEDERLAVCSLLSEIDKTEASEYENEIREITRKQIIHGGVRQVEQSKISIDVEPLRRWAERNIKDAYNRYQTLLDAGIISESEIPSPRREEPPVTRKTDALPQVSDDAGELLFKMVSTFLNECFTNSYHGLDCYLSMRIRHGALSGQLRGPLEDEKIITQRKVGSDEYTSNEFWVKQLQAKDRRVAQKVDDRLKRFSKDYDSLINAFAKDKVQIYGAERREGFFHRGIASDQLLLLEHEIHRDTSFDGFAELCFRLFWDVVDVDLEKVRNYIDDALKPQLNRLFSSLIADIESETLDFEISELDNALRSAQTKAQQALDEVKDWFRSAKPNPRAHFSFEELIGIGAQQVKRMHRNFDPDIRASVAALPAFVQLNRFSDIFYIIFENIQRHSGIRDRPVVDIEASISDDMLHITVESDVASTARSAESEERIRILKQTMAEDEVQRAARSEGGTGMIKLRNIIEPDRDGNSYLNFGFTEGDRFKVSLRMSVRPFRLTESESV